ncbi:MAG: Holliday junction resolvase Hjc [Candidatus Woesearchaeota archaeon]
MAVKHKGINAERELIHMLWAAGWAAVRVAGSGSSRYPSPDVLAGNNLRKVAIECKAVHNKNKYLPQEEVENLLIFAKRFGAEPWVGIRFDKEQWYFLGPEELIKTKESYKISLQSAKLSGLLFEELIK